METFIACESLGVVDASLNEKAQIPKNIKIQKNSFESLQKHIKSISSKLSIEEAFNKAWANFTLLLGVDGFGMDEHLSKRAQTGLPRSFNARGGVLGDILSVQHLESSDEIAKKASLISHCTAGLLDTGYFSFFTSLHFATLMQNNGACKLCLLENTCTLSELFNLFILSTVAQTKDLAAFERYCEFMQSGLDLHTFMQKNLSHKALKQMMRDFSGEGELARTLFNEFVASVDDANSKFFPRLASHSLSECAVQYKAFALDF